MTETLTLEESAAALVAAAPAKPPEEEKKKEGLVLYRAIRDGLLQPNEVSPATRLNMAIQMWREGSSMFSICETLGFKRPEKVRERIFQALEKDGRSILAAPPEAFLAGTFGRLEDLYEKTLKEGDYGTARLILSDLWRMGQDMGRIPKAPMHTIVEVKEPEVPLEERLSRIRRFLDMAKEEGIVISVPTVQGELVSKKEIP